MPEFRTAGPAVDAPSSGLGAFEVAGTKVAVADVDGTLYASDDTCTHKQCSLSDGDLEGTRVICPCHGGTFDVTTGAVLEGPPPLPVAVYRVRVRGDDLEIEI